jgi:hypothetical protein
LFLKTINPGEGCWVNSQGQANEVVEGQEATDAKIQLNQGWNLVGFKANQSYAIETLLGTKGQKVNSIWKWENSTWSVYLPTMSDKGQGYAQAKGFGFLQTIQAGEGFWVNAKEGFVME